MRQERRPQQKSCVTPARISQQVPQELLKWLVEKLRRMVVILSCRSGVGGVVLLGMMVIVTVMSPCRWCWRLEGGDEVPQNGVRFGHMSIDESKPTKRQWNRIGIFSTFFVHGSTCQNVQKICSIEHDGLHDSRR